MNDNYRNQPLLLVIFGITGDLAQRYELPALYQLCKHGELPKQLRIVGISRRSVDIDEVYGELAATVNETSYDASIEAYLRAHTEMRQMDLDAVQDYNGLLDYLRAIETGFGPQTNRLYYLSIPPQTFPGIVRLLGQTGHSKAFDGHRLPRLLVEKPFGTDTASAKALIATVAEHFADEQIYRIDHYVAKETVQTMLPFRFQNPLFKSVWNGEHISDITILAHEKIDIEGRVGFFDQTGALRDLIQNHLLQMLAMVTMEEPEDTSAEAFHTAKLAALQAIVPIASDEVATHAIRAQYEGYRQEVDNPQSITETYAKVQLGIQNEHWQGVSIMLETGKALYERRTEVRITFGKGKDKINQLVFRTQPEEAIVLKVASKKPGLASQAQETELLLDYARAYQERSVGAYERIIVDAMRGDQTIFTTAAEVIRSWEIIEMVLEQWSKNGNGLKIYPKGSTTPAVP